MRKTRVNMKRAADDEEAGDAAAAAALVRAKLMRKPAQSQAVVSAPPPAAAPTAAPTASPFARPSGLFMKPRALKAPSSEAAAASSQAAPSHAAPSSHAAVSSDAQHAAAIFGAATQRRKPPPPPTRDQQTEGPSATAPTEEGALWQTLRVGSECLARLDGLWTHVRVVSTVHAGFENARFKVVPVAACKEPGGEGGSSGSRYGGSAPPPPGAAAATAREVGVDQVRSSMNDASRLSRGRCRFFDEQGACKRGDRCPFAHLPRAYS